MTTNHDAITRAIELSAQDISAIVDERISSNGAPGVVCALFSQDGSLYFQGSGNRELSGPPPEVGTAFRVASCTKSFTAAAVLILRDRNLLSLDHPITKYLPAYRQVGPLADCAAPTLRMLLTMSAGFGTDDPWADREESITPTQLEDHVAQGVYLISIPGSRFEYSNLGYALLGRVVELTSGLSFPDFVTREFFTPLGLTDSSFSVEESTAPTIAVGYRRRGQEWLAQEFSSPGSFSSIGGVFSSARDLATWANWLSTALDPDTPETGPLCKASRREMQQSHVPMPFSSKSATTPETAGRLFTYGYGLHVDIDETLGKFVSHSGGYPGYSAHMRWHASSGLGVIVLENGRYSGAWATATTVLERVLVELPHNPPNPLNGRLNEFIIKTSELISDWDDALADELCAPNVALDIPYQERAEEISALIGKVGPVHAPPEYEVELDESPLYARWLIPGEKGSLLCELRLTPVEPLRIQTLRVAIL